ncbi:host cell division inhibitor Icd-like protein [Yersinia enterocolitica]|nr:host cell division inhibitor Icd-like protein [Yersinia enterocolitica]EKN6114311.1 host cell division inhibitor Icd-like protein [Yersinia enterocolitica]
MYNLTVQNEAFTLAGYLSKVDIENACNLSKPDIESAIARSSTHINEGFIGVTTRGGLSFATSTRDEFSDSIKKGSTANATLWPHVEKVQSFGFLRWRSLISLCATSTMALIFSPAFVPISSIRASASSALLRLDSNLFSSLSLSWRRAISSCIAVTIKPALLSPSIFTASIPSITSCGMRMDICFDLSLTVFVAMFSTLNKTCDSVYMKSNHTKHLKCDSFDCNLNHTLSTDKAQAVHKITKPSSALTLTGPLTTNDRLSIEVAMLNHTPTRFKFLFLAVHRSEVNAKPHRKSVTAHSEQDARRSLAGQFVLSFAGRLPEVSHGA